MSCRVASNLPGAFSEIPNGANFAYSCVMLPIHYICRLGSSNTELSLSASRRMFLNTAETRHISPNLGKSVRTAPYFGVMFNLSKYGKSSAKKCTQIMRNIVAFRQIGPNIAKARQILSRIVISLQIVTILASSCLNCAHRPKSCHSGTNLPNLSKDCQY